MNDKFWDSVRTGFFTFVGIAIIALTAGGAQKISNAVQSTITCTNESIPFETVTHENFLRSDDYVGTYGVDGSKEVCKNNKGEVTRTTVKTEPVTQVNYDGTYVAPVYTPPANINYNEPQGGGAICNDGSRSNSTGRGTCSWHGGVNYYL